MCPSNNDKTQTSTLDIILRVALGLGVFFAAARGVTALMRWRLDEVIRERMARHTIVRQAMGANFFGLSSRGMAQARGNGGLVLATDEIFFVLFAPRREFTIPLRDVVAVSSPRSHLGKKVGMRLLKVEFNTPDGMDSAAWAVSDVDAWMSDIERHTPFLQQTRK